MTTVTAPVLDGVLTSVEREMRTVPSIYELLSFSLQDSVMGVQNDTNQFDLFGRFQDAKLQTEYVAYCMEQKWKYSFAVILTLILILTFIETVTGTWFNEELTVEGVDLRDVEIYGIVFLCLIAIAASSGIALVWNPSMIPTRLKEVLLLSIKSFSCFHLIFCLF